jgi:hypothetical protein
VDVPRWAKHWSVGGFLTQSVGVAPSYIPMGRATSSPLNNHHASTLNHHIAAGCSPVYCVAISNSGPNPLSTASVSTNFPSAPLAPRTAEMGLSKSTRIMILLGIDTAFFFLELIVGYSVHSLALVADSFHMVCSLALCVPMII